MTLNVMKRNNLKKSFLFVRYSLNFEGGSHASSTSQFGGGGGYWGDQGNKSIDNSDGKKFQNIDISPFFI